MDLDECDENEDVDKGNIKRKQLEWDKGTYLITDESLILGLQERKMGRNTWVLGMYH